MPDFSEISTKYEKDSLVQKSASEVLLELAEIGPDDDVLDLGCGTGHITGLLRERTGGTVVGVDAAEGMIAKAVEKFRGRGIRFRRCAADALGSSGEFDLIFCNSTFQWFTDPMPVLAACHEALRAGGRMVVQAPATNMYCPNFLQAVDEIRNDASTKETFAGFISPWLFLDSAGEYARLFEAARFSVRRAFIDKVTTRHTPEEVFRIFGSGAAAGYLNPSHYSTRVREGYLQAFGEIAAQSFKRQADESGMVALTFHRIYLLAQRPEGRPAARL
jgi:trans-aconitate methyltransferase